MREERTIDAYADSPLTIGHGQTISQPYMVARMTAAVGLEDAGWPWERTRPSVLDVGTGSGYQAAVLAETGARVTSIERDPDLAAWARRNLARAGYDVEVLIGDGSVGYPAHAPYAAIVVGAGAPAIPEPLKDQLAEGGRLAIPVGDRRSQRLMVVRRQGRAFEERAVDRCVFVPLVGAHGHAG